MEQAAVTSPGMPRRWRRWLFRLVLTVALYGVLELTSLISYSCLEHRLFSFRQINAERDACREFGDSTPLQADPTGEPLFVLHPYLGLVLNKHWRGIRSQKSPFSDYGFADPHPPLHKRGPGKVIVGIVGGSVASIFFDEGAPTLERELKKDPRYAGKHFEFVNLAVYGYRQPQQIMALEYALALGCEFDLVVNIDGFNEVALYPAENALVAANPLYPIRWHTSLDRVGDQKSSILMGALHLLREQRAQIARQHAAPPLRYSVTASLLWKLRDRRQARLIDEKSEELQQHLSTGLPDWTTGPRQQLLSPEAMYDELAQIWKRCSLQVDRTCHGHGIRYYHFLQPNQYPPGAKPMGAEEKRRAYLPTHPLAPHAIEGYRRLRGLGPELVSAGVHFHDLTLAFAHVEEPLYTDNCCHFNASGNEILAQQIARLLLETAEPPEHETERH